MIDTDSRLDYASANAALLHLTSARINWLTREKRVVYPDILEMVRFDLSTKAGEESADYFLSKFKYSLH